MAIILIGVINMVQGSPQLASYLSQRTLLSSSVMTQFFSSNVISIVDIGLGPEELYIPFVPPASFGVIYNVQTGIVFVVRSNGERNVLRRTPDKIYVLRGFIGLRRRENRALEIGLELEDEIIRTILRSFGSLEKLCTATETYCPLRANANTITDRWGPSVFNDAHKGISRMR